MREIIGRETLKLRLRQGATIEAALEILIRRYGDTLRQKLSQKRNWVIMLNDRNITFLEDMETKLNDGDQIAILSPLSGG
jgi:MoaD family protein